MVPKVVWGLVSEPECPLRASVLTANKPAPEPGPSIFLKSASMSCKKESKSRWMRSKKQFQFLPRIGVHGVVLEVWIKADQGILGSNIQVVVDLPVNLPHPPCWMEETLNDVGQDKPRSQRHSTSIDGTWSTLKSRETQPFRQLPLIPMLHSSVTVFISDLHVHALRVKTTDMK